MSSMDHQAQLSNAIRCQDHKKVIGLLNGKASACYSDPSTKITPLHLAASFECLEICRTLIDYGAQVNAQDHIGITPLHRAAFCNRTEIAGLLISRSAEINRADNYGNTPLHEAAYRGNLRTLLVLLEKGANPLLRNNLLESARDLAASLEIKGVLNTAQLDFRRHQDNLIRETFGNQPKHR